MLYYTVLCYAILCYPMLCYTIPYYTMLYHTIPYYTKLGAGVSVPPSQVASISGGFTLHNFIGKQMQLANNLASHPCATL